MQAGQTGYGLNGKQNFLFPIDEMYITQGSYTATYSHNGCYAMDFIGWGNGHRIYNCPYYAPFGCKLVARWGSSSPSLVWESTDEVNFVDGTTGYACVQFTHDDNVMSYTIGETRIQGDLIGHTGTYGASADHVHIEAKKGTYNGYYRNSYGVYMLRDSTWLYNLMGVNDTVLTKTYYVNHNNVRVNYPWREFSDSPYVPPVPIHGKKGSGFPWVLYANKLRTGKR